MGNLISRRLTLIGMGAAVATPSIALPTPGDLEADRLWRERQLHVEALRPLSKAFDEIHEQLPAWAKSGPRMIDNQGNPCDGYVVNWPLEAVTPPPTEWIRRVVRPSTGDIEAEYEFYVRVFARTNEAARARARARADQRLADLEARIQERHRLLEDLGMPAIDRQIQATCDGLINCEVKLENMEPNPNAVAAFLMANLGNECEQDATASGDATMKVTALAVEGLLPKLSGLIREHAAFFVAHRTTPLSEMPFKAS